MGYQKNFIESARFEFHRYQTLGEGTFVQLDDTDIHWRYRKTDNSIGIIVKHMVGNMRSRWTNFLKEDGEKVWRNREKEFEDGYASKKEMLIAWHEGWACLYQALDAINSENFDTPIRIRAEQHTLVEAVHRQLAHYSNHVGQIVFVGKMIKGEEWKSLSIPKGGSAAFNKEKFGL